MSRQGWIIASACGLTLFLAVVLSQPLLEPAYDPLRQGISEFVHTDAEGLALFGFLSWAFSLAILGALVRRATTLEALGLGAAVLGLLLVTCFATDRGAEVAGEVIRPTTAGRIHDIGSGLVTAGVLLAVVADAVGRRDLRSAAAVIVAAVVSSAILFTLGDPLPGLRQRCLIACACVWQVFALLQLWRVAPTLGRSSAGSRCSTS